jgi:hypothetical protein
VGVASRLVGNDALAAVLVPGGLGAPGGDVHWVFADSAEAGWTVTSRTVLAAGAAQTQSD